MLQAPSELGYSATWADLDEAFYLFDSMGVQVVERDIQ
jgi:hypothetical protein